MSERPTATVRLGWLLQLPGDLEGQFWAASDTQWLLCTMDLLAFMMVLPNVIAAVLGRVNKSLPQGVELPMGAKAILMLYWLVSVRPVGLMLLNFQHYKKHRTKLAVASRLYRLVGPWDGIVLRARKDRWFWWKVVELLSWATPCPLQGAADYGTEQLHHCQHST
jgi:hypothetical protein